MPLNKPPFGKKKRMKGHGNPFFNNPAHLQETIEKPKIIFFTRERNAAKKIVPGFQGDCKRSI